MKYIVFLFILLFTHLTQAKIDVTFEPKSISKGNTVELVISSDTPFQGVPNLNILEKDFVVGGQQRSQSAQWINGKGTTTYQLIYTLFPNKTGTLSVKGLKIGNDLLPEATLTVTQGGSVGEQQGNLTLSINCPNTSLYPAQRLLCQLTLEDTMGVVDGELLPPNTEGGTWEQLLPLLPSNQSTNGTHIYQGVFVFTPTQSGSIEIDPFTFNGQARFNTSQPIKTQSMLDFMLLGFKSTATKPVVVQTQPFQLKVKEKPADYNGWWLPSSRVTLTANKNLPSPIHVGEPITVTLTLFAQDIAAANLPVPLIPQASGFKVYTNPEQRQDIQTGAELTVDITFVPTQEGTLHLPAISVPWFNTNTQTIQQATVPSTEIFVESGATESPYETTAQTEPVSLPSTVDENTLPTQQAEKTPVHSIPWFVLGLSVLIAFVAGILIAFLIFKRLQKKSQTNKKKAPLPDLYPF